jgi:hypothetical protein
VCEVDEADGETSASVRLRVRRLPEGHSFRELTLADVPVQDESRTLRIIRQLRREREDPTTLRSRQQAVAAASSSYMHGRTISDSTWRSFFRLKHVAANRAAASTPVPQNEILKGKFLPQRLVVTLVGLPRSARSEMVFLI